MFSFMKNISLTKEEIDKPDEFCDSFPFSSLPDDIALQILSKLTDLKTLCICKLVSVRFNRIIHQVDTISVTGLSKANPSFGLSGIVFKLLHLIHSMFKLHVSPSPLTPSPLTSLPLPTELDPAQFYQWESFPSVMKSLMSFTKLKCLHMELPPFLEDVDSRYLFKWKTNTGHPLESFVFLSPNSIYNTKGSDVNESVHDEEAEFDIELYAKRLRIPMYCIHDGSLRRWILSSLIPCFPLLENATITDRNSMERISISGAEITDEDEMIIDERFPFSETVRKILIRNNCDWSYCYVPLLELPVTGYVMKGVTLILCMRNDLPEAENESSINFDFEDKEEAAYSEAVTEIFKNHRGRIERMEWF